MADETLTYAALNARLGGEQLLPVYELTDTGQVLTAYLPVGYMTEADARAWVAKMQSAVPCPYREVRVIWVREVPDAQIWREA